MSSTQLLNEFINFQGKNSKFPSQAQCRYFDKEKQDKAPQKIVYVCGAFDLFHHGHVAILEKAKKMGDYVVVGLHSNETSRKHRKYSTPLIMSLHERLFNLLSCKYVDDVVIDAPWEITRNFMTTFGIQVVIGISQGLG